MTHVNPDADTLQLVDSLALALNFEYQVRPTEQGWIEVRVNPKRALRDGLDFVRIVRDDNTYRLLHMTHNEVLKGEVALSGSMASMLPGLVRETAETIW